MTNPSMLVVDTVKKKVLPGLLTVSEAVAAAGFHLSGLHPWEIVDLNDHAKRVAKFEKKEWGSGSGWYHAYMKRLGWLTEKLVPKKVGLFDELVPVPVAA